jgi:hypothetical protein
VNDELETIWKVAFVTNFKVLSGHLPGGTEEKHKIIGQDIRSPGIGLDPGPPEYEAGVLTTRSRRSIVRMHFLIITVELPYCVEFAQRVFVR